MAPCNFVNGESYKLFGRNYSSVFRMHLSTTVKVRCPVLPKCWYLFTKLHGMRSYIHAWSKTVICRFFVKIWYVHCTVDPKQSTAYVCSVLDRVCTCHLCPCCSSEASPSSPECWLCCFRRRSAPGCLIPWRSLKTCENLTPVHPVTIHSLNLVWALRSALLHEFYVYGRNTSL